MPPDPSPGQQALDVGDGDWAVPVEPVAQGYDIDAEIAELLGDDSRLAEALEHLADKFARITGAETLLLARLTPAQDRAYRAVRLVLDGNQTTRAPISRALLARLSGTEPGNVSHALRPVIDAGLLRAKRSPGTAGRQPRTVYSLPSPRVERTRGEQQRPARRENARGRASRERAVEMESGGVTDTTTTNSQAKQRDWTHPTAACVDCGGKVRIAPNGEPDERCGACYRRCVQPAAAAPRAELVEHHPPRAYVHDAPMSAREAEYVAEGVVSP